MLVVLDPGFFREVGIDSEERGCRDAAATRLLERLEDANRLLASSGAALVVAVDALAWFDTVYRQEARVIEGAADRHLKQALTRLREHRKKGRTLRGVPLLGKMYGVAMMADWMPFGRSWRSDLERVLAASAVAAAEERTRVVFLCQRIEGRNVRDRSSEHVSLVEVLRWRLSLAVQGAPTTVVPCVGRLRHLEVEWTRRMDDRLPDQHGPGLHPYCPPARWMSSQTQVWRTQKQRPCWLDSQGNGWARPSTGGGYHWDVYLTPQAEEHIGLSQINITQHGAPLGQGQPGDLHHVPREKRSRLNDLSGWRCRP